MSDYRFHLQKYRPGSKIACPRCGRHRCFTRYVDEDGLVEFPSHVGRCDHQNSCGYHFSPREYFAQTPVEKTKGEAPVIKPVATPKATLPTVMETTLMERSLTAYHLNPLFRFFCTVMGKDEAKRMFLLYNVGTSKAWGGSTVFWQVDLKGRVRAGKVMGYDPTTGHRVKEPQSQVAWVHSLLKIPLDLKQCLFGEHPLRDSGAQQVVIVESEKSALIGAWKMPEYVWLATGGIHMLKPSEALRGRDVILIPDLGAEETWRAKMSAFKSVCRSVCLSDFLSRIATQEQRQRGLDIADFILMTPTVGMVIEQMKQLHPELDDFISDMRLTATSTSEGPPDEMKITHSLAQK